MPKKLLLLIYLVIFSTISIHAYVTINSSAFPDDNFRNYLLSQSYGEDYVLTDNEIANIWLFLTDKSWLNFHRMESSVNNDTVLYVVGRIKERVFRIKKYSQGKKRPSERGSYLFQKASIFLIFLHLLPPV